MGRPRKQTVDYFPHFVTTDSRTKFILEQSWGNDGYAFWFKLLELLGRSEGHYYDLSTTANKRYLAALMKIEESKIYEIIGTLVDLGNIDRELWEQHKVIWCQSLVDNLADVYSKRTVSAPLKPFEERPPEEEKPEKQKAPEKKKEPEEKPKAKRTRKPILTAEQLALFERFYQHYPKKVDRATAERAWAKIEPQPDEEMTEKIIQAVEEAKKHDSRFRERQFTPNPASWLNAKGYMNEYTPEQRGGESYGGFGGQQTDGGGFKPSGGFKS